MHILHVTINLLYYCGSIIILLTPVCARVCMCVRKLMIKELAIFKIFPGLHGFKNHYISVIT